MQSRFSRKTFLAKFVAGLSLAGLTGTRFASRAEASSRPGVPAGPAVKMERRAISRDLSGRQPKL